MNLLDSRPKLGAAERAGKMNKPIRLLLVDDHPVVRKGLRFYLAPHPNFEIAGEASNSTEAVRKPGTVAGHHSNGH